MVRERSAGGAKRPVEACLAPTEGVLKTARQVAGHRYHSWGLLSQHYRDKSIAQGAVKYIFI